VKLVASLVVHNELSRYLELCLDSLLDFCDEIRVLDDHSSDGTYEWLDAQGDGAISVCQNRGSSFYEHEGRVRQMLLNWTLLAEPTHIIAIDADEFVADGRMVRKSLQNEPNHDVWTLGMQEIWKADENQLYVRRDGGWRPAETTCLFRVPPELPTSWGIADKQLACGREPVYVRQQFRSALRTGTEVLHFGWTNEAERRARYTRYEVADGGRFHASQHLQSILWPDNRVRLQRREWPSGLLPYKETLLEKVRQPR
jgi:glycosyltransferase involved in cell wall biosynthesis